jgi:hypothetical protein
LDLPDEVHRRLELAKNRRGAEEQGDEADDGCPRAPLWGRGGENRVHELAPGRPHEALELGGQLTGHLLPLDHQPRQADDEQHQRRQGQRGVERQGRREPQAVVVPPVLCGA